MDLCYDIPLGLYESESESSESSYSSGAIYPSDTPQFLTLSETEEEENELESDSNSEAVSGDSAISRSYSLSSSESVNEQVEEKASKERSIMRVKRGEEKGLLEDSKVKETELSSTRAEEKNERLKGNEISPDLMTNKSSEKIEIPNNSKKELPLNNLSEIPNLNESPEWPAEILLLPIKDRKTCEDSVSHCREDNGFKSRKRKKENSQRCSKAGNSHKEYSVKRPKKVSKTRIENQQEVKKEPQVEEGYQKSISPLPTSESSEKSLKESSPLLP